MMGKRGEEGKKERWEKEKKGGDGEVKKCQGKRGEIEDANCCLNANLISLCVYYIAPLTSWKSSSSSSRLVFQVGNVILKEWRKAKTPRRKKRVN